MLDQQDLRQILNKGISPETIRSQIDHFITGFPFICLDRPAVPGDGMVRFDEGQLDFYSSYFENRLPGLKVVKFVPASGAASRMFRHLFEFREQYTPDEAGKSLYLRDQGFNSVHYFISNLGKIAFYDDLAETICASGTTVGQLLEQEQFPIVIDHILGGNGLNYANLPKALLKFHKYTDGARTAAEEHLVEASAYTRDGTGTARVHFTVSPEHQEKFTELFSGIKCKYESAFDVKFEISFSNQKASTDIIAVDEANEPFRNADGTLLFRPGGHGALLENLNEIDADLVFIKNIDNLVPDHLKSTTIRYKKVLGGYLLSLKEIITGFLRTIKDRSVQPAEIPGIVEFAKNNLFIDFPEEFQGQSFGDQLETLTWLLDRPVRVCGMVRNEGEPGGGPFWVRGDDHRNSLQIVETSQIDLQNRGQKEIADRSTHFNPVDLVCSTINYKGRQFDLKNFVDENTGFISYKSSGGKTLKAQELPGLWNGAMAGWITVFVEIPVITFNPVKTVNDLLRNEHLPEQL